MTRTMLETISEPPYGWTTPVITAMRDESAGVIPDYATELDVIDPEYSAARAWVRCEDCDEPGEAIDMVWQHDGAWLCWHCDIRGRHEYEEQRAYLEKIRYS